MMRPLHAMPSLSQAPKLAMALAMALAFSALCLPAAAAAPHTAEWTRVGRSSNPEVYLDLRSIKDDNGGRSASVLRNYRKPQTSPDGKPYRSVRAQHLYACKDHTATMQAQAFYPDPMGKGEAVGNFKYEQYDAEKIPPGSTMDSVLKRVCRKGKARR
jgi:hypothetical protein